MANYCGTCAWLDTSNKERYTSKNRYYCKKRGNYFELTDISCYNYINDPSKGIKTGTYTPAGCYITTIICNILGYDDNCELLTTLRNFRDKYLKLNINYLPLLIEYDYIGPIISQKIYNAKDNYSLSLNLLKNFLLPCFKLIKDKNYEEAIKEYINMVNYLKEIFNIKEIVPENYSYDLETVGKARIRTANKLLKGSI